MGKKFAEYSKFDLSEVNKEVLKKWDENQVFAKSMTEREGCPSFPKSCTKSRQSCARAKKIVSP